MSLHQVVNCPRCGASFECKMGSIAICHCSQVMLTDEQKEYIADQWDGCLCHACLKVVAEMPVEALVKYDVSS